ncbi:uncharacterized protein HGUI_00963 [Hanseniaspora guilliermondii]|uniref:Ribosomal protein bL31m N-terminal domain-containing protein n=1 Tax=Hanseniaspora guilliermondii TaxID=56406 RepID=A0A1L0B1B9_9ASCO|nr:uncharacterized protein HGUI_00963 [Hanseniaspora guilliermondii]
MLSNVRAAALPVLKRSYAVGDKSFEAYLAKKDAMSGAVKIILPNEGKPLPEYETPATLYYLFEQHIALTDGSVIKRYSQYPRKKIVSLQDIKSNVIYNPYRPDLAQKKIASSSVDKFKEKFKVAGVDATDNVQVEETADAQGDFDYDNMDDFLDLLGTTDVTGETKETKEAYVVPDPSKETKRRK